MRTMQRFSVVGANASARRGFTLTELLVVIAIMAILASLISAAVQRARVGQYEKTTESTLSKVQQGIDQQIHAINQGVRQERTQKTDAFRTLFAYCDANEDRAEALLTYCRVKQAFPQTAAEVAAPSFNVGGVTFPRPVAFATLANITGNPDHVSSALLYVAITKRTIQGYSFPVDDAIGNASSDITLNGVNCRVFVDAWKQPIGFRRFYETAELDTAEYANAKTGLMNAFDTTGKLASWTPATPAPNNRTIAEGNLGVTFNNRNKKLIVYSGGRNETYNALAGDDILSFRLKSIGK